MLSAPRFVRAGALGCAFALLLGTPFRPSSAAEAGDPYLAEIEQWREDRLTRLTSEDGWLTLVGLLWLDPGDHRIGTGEDHDIRLPAGSAPVDVGTLSVRGDRVRFRVAPGVDVRSGGTPVTVIDLADDQSGAPTVLEIGDLRTYVISRAGRYALRVKDSESFARRNFKGIEHFDTAPSWRVEARFEKYDPPKKLPVPTVVDDTLQELMSPGAVVFEIDGETYRIEAQADSSDDPLFLIFGDRTNGRTTYGGGRYLYTDPPSDDGSVVVDFNKTYNPPCAYTPFATCPLPPRANRLDLAIEAGEKWTPKPRRE